MIRKLVCIWLMAMVSQVSGAQLTINIRYTAENGNARKYAEEMESSGIAGRIRAIEGCIRYDYFFPADDPEGLLLIDEWSSQEALDRYHASPVMKEAAALREKYGLGGRQIRIFKPVEPSSDAVRPDGKDAVGQIDVHCHMIPEYYIGALKAVDVDANISRLYFDLAGAATDEALRSLLAITEPSHILYGSDYPYVAAPALVGAKNGLESRLGAHGLDRSVLAENAARIFMKQ